MHEGTGPLRITSKWVGIGCRADLESLTEEERAQVRELLASVAREEGYGLALVRQDAALREALAARINTEIGRRVFTDLYLEELAVEERVAS